MRLERALIFAAIAGASCASCSKAPIVEDPLTPEIRVEPTTLVFEGIVPGARPEQSVRVESIGVTILEISAIEIDNRDFVTGAGATELFPGGTLDVTVAFDASERLSGTGLLTIRSNDPDRSEVYVSLDASPKDCDLVTSQHVIIFSETDPDATLYLTNNGDEACSVQSIAIPVSSTFHFDAPKTAPFMLAPGESLPINIGWGMRIDSVNDVLAIDGEDPHEPHLEVQLVGRAYYDTHPCATLELVGSIFPTPVGGVSSQSVGIVNRSPKRCPIDVDVIDSEDMFSTVLHPAVRELEPEQSIAMINHFRPTREGYFFLQMTVTANGMMAGSYGLGGQAYVPRLCIEPLDAHLDTRTATIALTACEGFPVQVYSAWLDGSGPTISLSESGNLNWSLSPGETRTLFVDARGSIDEGSWLVNLLTDGFPVSSPSVHLTVGGELVPVSAGRFLEYEHGFQAAERFELQGRHRTYPLSGLEFGRYRALSPDGRYASGMFERGARVTIVDRVAEIPATIPAFLDAPLAWRPIVDTTPAYQFAYVEGQKLELGSLFADEPLATLVSESRSISWAAWGPNGSIVYLAADRDLILVDEASGAVLDSTSIDFQPNAAPASFSPNGRWIALSTSTGIEIYDANDLRQTPIRLTELGEVARDPVFSLDGAFLAYVSDSIVYIVPVDPLSGIWAGPPFEVAQASGAQHPLFSR